MAKQKVVEEGTFLQLDPNLILADDNTRFGLKQSRIESLAADILAKGGVMENVEVQLLDTPSNGHQYRLTAGGYRHAAVLHLNKTQGAGLLLPVIVHTPTDALDRLRRQVGENYEREAMSPMDTAVAIDKMLKAGASKIDVRATFSRPGTTKKGGKPIPASNAWVNIHLKFLDFPEKIQKLIHSGELGVNAAYELTRLPADKWEAVIEKAQAERQKASEREEKDEEKYLASEKKAEEAEAKVKEADAVLAKAQAVVDADAKYLEDKTSQAEKAYTRSKSKEVDPATRKAAAKVFEASEKERKGAEAKLGASTKDLEKIKADRDKAAETAKERSAKLLELRTAAKPTTVGRREIASATREEGVGTKALIAVEMRRYLSELMLPGTAPKVLAIATAIQHSFAGNGTEKDLYKVLCKITGEKAVTHNS